MTISIDGSSVRTEDAARILGVPADTLNTWRRRNGILPWKKTGRGIPMSWTFSDLLRASVAKKLISNGFPVTPSCRYVSNVAGFTQQFVKGEDVRIAIREGEAVMSSNPLLDVFITFSLEVDGWQIAEGLLEEIAATHSPEAADEARRDFEAKIAMSRRSD